MQVQLAIKNFPAQQEIFDSKARYKIASKGRRFGITKGAVNDYIKCSLSGTFKKGLWVDTVNTNIDRYIERYFMPHLKQLPSDMWSWRKQDKMVMIKDSYIDFRSSDRPENIEGFGYDKFFINEAGIVLKDAYLWNNAIRPMLWDYKASGVIGGTPKGKGIFEELFNRGLDRDQQDYASFRFTTFDNPYIQHEQIREDMKSMPERVIKQEIYAEFLDDTGVVFRGVTEIAVLQAEEPQPDHLYVIGADLAKVQDYTVLAVYDRTNNHQVYQMRFNKLEWHYQKERIKDLSKKYNDALILVDSTGVGEPIYEDLARAGVPIEPYHFTNESKKNLIEKLSTWIELKNCRMLKLDETIQELNSFTYDISSTGKVRYEAPVGFHDDIVIAHALAIWSLQPITKTREEDNLTIIQRDLYEKQRRNDEPEGYESYTI
jgi:phage FluMu gp28-like protein